MSLVHDTWLLAAGACRGILIQLSLRDCSSVAGSFSAALKRWAIFIVSLRDGQMDEPTSSALAGRRANGLGIQGLDRLATRASGKHRAP